MPIARLTSIRWKRSSALALAVVARRDAVLRQRRVQVDDVRHDRGAEDGRGQQHGVGAGEARDEALGGRAGVEADPQRVVEEAEDDEPEQPGDDGLEAPVALASAAPRIAKATTAVMRPGGEERHVEEQVQRDRGADELRQVGGHGDELGLDPQPPGHRPREVVAAQLGQVAPGGDADLGREVLDQHRHEVGARAAPTAAGSRTWRRRRCWWRSCRGRRRRCRRRRPARAGPACRAGARATAAAAGGWRRE